MDAIIKAIGKHPPLLPSPEGRGGLFACPFDPIGRRDARSARRCSAARPTGPFSFSVPTRRMPERSPPILKRCSARALCSSRTGSRAARYRGRIPAGGAAAAACARCALCRRARRGMHRSGLLQRTLPPDILENAAFTLRLGEGEGPEALEPRLLACGYRRSDMVEGPGQFFAPRRYS